MKNGITEKDFLELTNAHTPKSFSLEIENIVFKNQSSYIEAVLEYCKEKEIDMSIIPKLVNRQLKDKLETEAKKLNFIVDNTVELPI
jgi:hypothetical protein|tara:strand:- start:2655 stop:2915 length:261 start_codon:yes stop_codon:yes gene_type:complete